MHSNGEKTGIAGNMEYVYVNIGLRIVRAQAVSGSVRLACERRERSMLEKSSFGSISDGPEAHAYTLTTEHARATVSDFGATLLGVEVPDRDGNNADVILGFASVKGYAGVNGSCYGGIIGPMANRTDRAEVPIDGTVYHLVGNDGAAKENNLHSDLSHGLHKRMWEASYDEAENTLSLSCVLPDGELGLPGNRTFSASYTLTEPERGVVELTLRLGCTTDAKTVVNMTSHAYANLAGHDSGSVLGQVCAIDADTFLPLREDSVSEGVVEDVAGTPFDFRTPKTLGADIEKDCEQLRRARGYDHCLCVRGYEPDGAPRHAMRLEDPTTGRALDILITMPGAHLYTGNWVDDASGVKDDATYHSRDGVAFEPEFYPDFPHHPEWDQPVCEPGRPYAQTIVYRFSTI